MRRHQPVPMVAGLLRCEGKVLLAHRHPDRVSFPDVWDLPGGHVEPGEALGDALVRELSEELGVGVPLPRGEPWKMLAVDGTLLGVFIIDDWSGKPSNRASDEHDRVCWMDETELGALEFAHPAYLDMLLLALEES